MTAGEPHSGDRASAEGADISYYDPWVGSFGAAWRCGVSRLTREVIEGADLVMVTTAHTNVDYAFVQQHARAVFDTRML